MSARCVKCSWRFPSDEPQMLFCGQCGSAAAEFLLCETLKPKVKEMLPSEGLIFYPRQDNHQASTTLNLLNRGVKELPIQILSRGGYQFLLRAHSLDHEGNERIETLSTGWTHEYRGGLHLKPVKSVDEDSNYYWSLEIRLASDFPDQYANLELITPISQRPIEIPLIESIAPDWQVFFNDVKIKRAFDQTDLAVNLYPTARDVNHRWLGQLRALEGTGYVQELKLFQDHDENLELDLTLSEQPKLVRKDEYYEFEIRWKTNNTGEAKSAWIEVKLRNIDAPYYFPIRVHAYPQIDLLLEAEDPDKETIIQLDGETQKNILIYNNGNAEGLVEKITVNTPGIRLSEVILEMPPLPGRQDGDKRTQLCDQLYQLPAAVRESFIMRGKGPRDPGGIPAQRIHSLGIMLSPSVVLDDTIFKGQVTFTIRAMEDDGQKSAQTIHQTVDFSFLARKVTEVSGEHGYLLIDYGTVHTCAIAVNTKSNSWEEIPLDMESSQFKSVMRLRRSRAQENEFEFGEEVWENIAVYLKSVDFAAKLRLGTSERRCLRDMDNTIRMMTGTDATTVLLGEVLRRSRLKTGFDFERIYLTAPAVFAEREHDDLMAALAKIGYENRAQLVCTEPEAYLRNIVTDRSFMEQLNERVLDLANRPHQSHLLGYVFDFGGGTTDITFFEVDENREIELLYNYGYRELGGEAVTQLIASFIQAEINEQTNEVYPFPELEVGKLFTIQDQELSNQHLHNFGELRRQAEALKCSSDWNQELSLDLRDVENETRQLDLTISQDKLDAHIKELLLDPAIRGLLTRIDLMKRAGHIATDAPEIIIVAGNSGMLRGLKEYLEGISKDLNEDIPPLYFYDRQHAKTGVVKGLKLAVDQSDGLGLERREVTTSWLYLVAGGKYELISPAGAPLNHHVGDIHTFLSDPVHSERFLNQTYFISSPIRISGLRDTELVVYASETAATELDPLTQPAVTRMYTFKINVASIPSGKGFYRTTLIFYQGEPLLYLCSCRFDGQLNGDFAAVGIST